MGIFGWSYPPGVSRLPWDDINLVCDICLGNPEATSAKNPCLCPECEICGTVGDPDCYGKGYKVNHGLQVRWEHLPIIEARRKAIREEEEQQRLADIASYEFDKLAEQDALTLESYA